MAVRVLKPPFGPSRVIHLGDDESATETQRVLDARGAFTLAYMEKQGWGEDVGRLTVEQIMEIREQPEWKKP